LQMTADCIATGSRSASTLRRTYLAIGRSVCSLLE
jgi:hypothetical protein